MYDWLFKRLVADGWSFSLGEPGAFLDVYRNLRNTMHNNGRFYSSDGSDSSVAWDGEVYEFQHAQVPLFVNWDFNLLALETLVALNEQVMQQPLVASLPPVP